MFLRLFIAALCTFFFMGNVQNSFAQEAEEEGIFTIEKESEAEFKPELQQESGSFIIEEELEGAFKTELKPEEPKPRYITADQLTTKDVAPAVNYYIRSDITRKFSGLVTNLKLEKIYGVMQEDKIATVYFDYKYTSIRNKDNVLYEKGKMTFMKFNSGRWFNAELSIFLMDSYPFLIKIEQQTKEE